MKTQQEVNNFFQENTVHVAAIYQIVQYLKDLNLKLPNNVILHENGICQTDFFKWFENGPFKPGDVLVSEAGNLVLFSHLEKDMVYYHCILNPFDKFEIRETPDYGVGKSRNCRLASDNQKQRLLDRLKKHGYEFDSKTNSLKKLKYPNTFAQCKETLSFKDTAGYARTISFKYALLVESLDRILICRDAYWKIAGEQMGLDKPWEPNWNNTEIGKHCIFWDLGDIDCDELHRRRCLLSFPTEEMRDTFYDNFKDLIEQCKELL